MWKKITKILSDFFSGGVKPNPSKPAPKRRYVKDVKPDECINIEWYRFRGGIAQVKCLNNDPETRKIWLEINWINLPKEHLVLDYRDDKLANFHLLNQVIVEGESSEEDFDLITLTKKMNECIDREEYEKAEEYQSKINNLSKK